MALFMTQSSLTPEAWAKLVKNPENREAAVRALLEKLGGRLLGYYYCFGEYDVVIISEIPDEVTAMSGLLAGISSGVNKATKTTVLLTTEQAMEAMRRAGKLTFSAPKG
jgi:uncharacterized protein with GYD domain